MYCLGQYNIFHNTNDLKIHHFVFARAKTLNVLYNILQFFGNITTIISLLLRLIYAQLFKNRDTFVGHSVLILFYSTFWGKFYLMVKTRSEILLFTFSHICSIVLRGPPPPQFSSLPKNTLIASRFGDNKYWSSET